MPVDAITPYIHVADVQRSIDFYRRLGLDVANVHEDDGMVVWAFLTSPADDPNHARARLMVGLHEGPAERRHRGRSGGHPVLLLVAGPSGAARRARDRRSGRRFHRAPFLHALR
jgi:catechol 2,3-dioxygenase-like lactoylglutathione lyase family enzyme